MPFIIFVIVLPNDKKVFSKIKFSTEDTLDTDPSNHEHLVDVVNHSVVTVTSTDCRNCYMNDCYLTADEPTFGVKCFNILC